MDKEARCESVCVILNEKPKMGLSVNKHSLGLDHHTDNGKNVRKSR